MKKRTLLDRVRDAIRAFRGKQIGSVTFGIDVKRCSECDNGAGVLYLCDRTKCRKCSPECKYTADIRHAKNFKCLFDDGDFWEIDNSGEDNE